MTEQEITTEDTNSENKKMWKGTKNWVRLDISIYGRKAQINIGKDVLRVLGGPSYICLKINRDMDSLLIMPCKDKDTMSFKVPDNFLLDGHKQMVVTSQSFVSGLLSINSLSAEHTYKISGIYSEKNNAVVFNMADIWIYGEDDNKSEC